MVKYRNLPKMIKISIFDSRNEFCHSLPRGPHLLSISKVSQITCSITPRLGFFGQIKFLVCFSLFFCQKCPILTKKWQFSWFSSLICCRLVHHCVLFSTNVNNSINRWSEVEKLLWRLIFFNTKMTHDFMQNTSIRGGLQTLKFVFEIEMTPKIRVDMNFE